MSTSTAVVNDTVNGREAPAERLFQPIRLGYNLLNRMLMVPFTLCRARQPSNVPPSPFNTCYCAQRALDRFHPFPDDPGISTGTRVRADAGYSQLQPVRQLAPVTDTVHKAMTSAASGFRIGHQTVKAR
jgi:2,4-dienoyl-CoA reductase-like NADH-dependent reductase (Old Yellow Enzyme family)